jgi:hypothetical protein
VVDNIDDGANENWAIVAGVAGDAPAEVRYMFKYGSNNYETLTLSRLDMPYMNYHEPTFMTYKGTPDIINVLTTDTTLGNIPIDGTEELLIRDKQLLIMICGIDTAASGDLSWRLGYRANSTAGADYYSEYVLFVDNWSTTVAEPGRDLSPQISALQRATVPKSFGRTDGANVRLQAKRATAAANFAVWYIQLMPRPVIRFVRDGGGAANPFWIYYDTTNDTYFETDDAAPAMYWSLDRTGDTLDLLPDCYNAIISHMADAGEYVAIADDMTFEQTEITPRWSIV